MQAMDIIASGEEEYERTDKKKKERDLIEEDNKKHKGGKTVKKDKELTKKERAPIEAASMKRNIWMHTKLFYVSCEVCPLYVSSNFWRMKMQDIY